MALELFINAEDEIIVEFAVGAAKDDPKSIYADVSVEKLKEVYDDVDDETIEQHKAVFRRPTFADISSLYDKAFSIVGTEIKANASSMRLDKMAKLLKSWTLKRPATAEEINRLNPIIALVIGSELDRFMDR